MFRQIDPKADLHEIFGLVPIAQMNLLAMLPVCCCAEIFSIVIDTLVRWVKLGSIRNER